MDFETRRNAIISAVELQGTVKVANLAKDLGVTEMTIRRDLGLLEQEGLVKRIHGGGIKTTGRSYEPTLALRSTVNIEQKKKIARLASELVLEGNFIALDVGSTAYEIARCLVGRRNITVITPSLYTANLFVNHPEIRLIVPGGIVRPGETSMIGELSHRAFDMLHVDRFFMGVGGIHARAGLTEYNWDDTLVKQAIMKNAKEIIVVADSSKFDRIATVNIASLERIDLLITERMPSPPLSDALQRANVKIITDES
jgi:DeoR family transcriptional regulator, fructose operon transcriptional repressor